MCRTIPCSHCKDRLVTCMNVRILMQTTVLQSHRTVSTFVLSNLLIDRNVGADCRKATRSWSRCCCQLVQAVFSAASEGIWTAGYRTSGWTPFLARLLKVALKTPAHWYSDPGLLRSDQHHAGITAHHFGLTKQEPCAAISPRPSGSIHGPQTCSLVQLDLAAMQGSVKRKAVLAEQTVFPGIL